MARYLNYIITFLTGAVISLMVICNTELGVATTNEVSLIVNQITGIILLTLILTAGRKNVKINPKREPAPWYMYFGGLFGIVIMILNFYTVLNIGATLAMGTAVFGQSAMGLIMDLTGFMGVEKRKISPLKWIALAVSFLGIIVMSVFAGGTFRPVYVVMGVVAGVVTMVQMVYNSTFAKKKGAVFSARQNVISGLGGIIVYAALLYPSATVEGLARLPHVPFYLIVAGGTLACFVVCSTNVIIPRIPAVYSALLLSSGQILASLLLDWLLYSTFSWALLAGTLLMLLGMVGNFAAESRT